MKAKQDSRPRSGRVTDRQWEYAKKALAVDPTLSSRALGELVGVSHPTAGNMKARILSEPEMKALVDGELTPTEALDVVDALERGAHYGLKVIVRSLEVLARGDNKDELKPATLRDLSHVVSVLVDKAQLLQGRPTSIAAILATSPGELDALILEHLERVRGMEVDAEVGRVG